MLWATKKMPVWWVIVIFLVLIILLIRTCTPLCADFFGWCLRLRRPVVHGEPDPNNRVVIFNHPTCFFEHLVLYWIFGPRGGIHGLAYGSPQAYLLLSHLGFLFVSKGGGHQTTRRIREYLGKTKAAFVISAYWGHISHESYDYGGALRGVGMPPRIKSIGFRVSESVQPAVILYEGLDIVPNSFSACWSDVLSRKHWVTPHVFLLPTMYRADYPTVEDFMEAVRVAMDDVLRRESVRLCTI